MAQKTLPKPGTYQARRTNPIVISETPNGALMGWIEYRLLNADIAFHGVHSVVLGKTDGTLMTKTFENLHKIFPTWTSNNPFELSAIPIPDGDGVEFVLVDCYIDDTYIPANSEDGQPVLQFKARWLNAVGDSRLPVVTPDEVQTIQSKWSSKWDAIGGKPAATPAKKVEVVEAEVVKPAAPKRGRPAAVKSAARTSSAEEVMSLLVKKYHPNGASEDEQQALGDKYYFPAQDKLFGVNVSAETLEQWGMVAVELGL